MVWTGVPPILIIHIWRHITTFIHFTSFHPVKAYIANPPILDTGMMKSGAPSGVNHWFPAERYMLCDGRVWNRLQKLQVWKAGYALGMHWVCSFIILASFIGKLQDRFKTLMQIQGALSPMGAGVQNAMACIHIPLQSVCPWPVQLGINYVLFMSALHYLLVAFFWFLFALLHCMLRILALSSSHVFICVLFVLFLFRNATISVSSPGTVSCWAPEPCLLPCHAKDMLRFGLPWKTAPFPQLWNQHHIKRTKECGVNLQSTICSSVLRTFYMSHE